MTPRAQNLIKLIEMNANAVAAAWNYYFIVLIGTVTVLAALVGEKGHITSFNMWGLCSFIGLFGLANFYSMFSLISNIRYLVREMSDDDMAGLQQAYGRVMPTHNIMLFQPIGWIFTIFFIMKNGLLI